MLRYSAAAKTALAAAFVFGIAILFPFDTPDRVSVPVGSVWNNRDVIAPFSFPVPIPHEQYQNAVDSVKTSILPRFSHDPGAAVNSMKDFNAVWNAFSERMLARNTQPDTVGILVPIAPEEVNARNAFAGMNETNVRRTMAAAKVLANNVLSSAVTQGIIDVAKDGVHSNAIMVREGHEEQERSRDSVRDTAQILGYLRLALSEQHIPPELTNAVAAMLRITLQPTLRYDARATEVERQYAIERIPRTLSIVARGERIVANGERIDAATLAKLNAWQEAQSARGETNATLPKYFSAVCFMLLMGILIVFYLFSLRKRLLADNQQLAIIGVILLFEAAFAFISMRVGDTFPVEYLIIAPAAAMLCTILFDSRTGFFFAVVTALITAAIRGGDNSYGLAAMVSGGLAAFTVRDLRSRTQLFRSIGYIFLGYAIAIVSFSLERADPFSRVLQELSFAAITAVFSPVITYASLIVFEKVFHVSSDLTLLEFDNINHPLLKELSNKAPGTFHHTMVIADMAERAANAIGANPILAKTGAYYHDIGKIKKPDFFVENQRDKKSRHERLTPQMSAQIISQHVKDGVALAKEYKLPQKIIDFIPMHHGTTVIAYFYDRALRRRRREDVNVEDFRYPGPKPQSKETAIVMLADSVEATVRSVPGLDERTIGTYIERTVRNRFLEGQLDECDLTANDILNIKEQFAGMLTGLHHPRIEYPAEVAGEPSQGAMTQDSLTGGEQIPEQTSESNGGNQLTGNSDASLRGNGLPIQETDTI